jgi:D-threo-aldose 1-dehydrogenase
MSYAFTSQIFMVNRVPSFESKYYTKYYISDILVIRLSRHKLKREFSLSPAHDLQVEIVSGLFISQLGIGTATLGGMYKSVSDEDGQAIVEAALDLGITYLDTAPHYGKGSSERRLGKYLQNYPRSAFTLSTKVGRLLVPTSTSSDPDFEDADNSVDRVFDFSGKGVERSLKESLERIGLDHVEIVLIHDPDDHADQAISEAFPALAKLREQGIIKAIGVGMNQSAIPTRFVKETDIDLVLIAGRYTLLDQGALADLLPAALKKGVSVIAAGVLNSGILGNPMAGATFDYAPASNEMIVKAQKIKELFERHDVTVQQAALQFPLRHPAVQSLLVGCRTGAEVRVNAANLDRVVPDLAWEEFDRLIAKF